MQKKLLFLEDLYDYYSSQNKNVSFNSKDTGTNIFVQTGGKMSFEDNNNEGLTPVVLQACHINKNLNQSNIDEEVMNAALPSFANKPILGHIHEVDGEPEFYGHNMHLGEDGEIIYDEIPVGIIPESCEAKLEYDEGKENTYCVVKGYLFNDYTKAVEILKRKKECSVSVEICIKELSYNAKEKYLDIKDFYFCGVTILGKDDDGNIVNPGMSGSNIKLSDFSEENNSVLFAEDINEKMIETLDKLNDTLSRFNIDSTRKDVNQMAKNLECFEEVVEDVTEEVIEEMAEEKEETIDESTEDASKVATDESYKANEPEEDSEEDPEEEDSEEENDNGDEAEDDEEEDEEDKFSVKKSLNLDENKVSYEISFDDITRALYKLIVQFEELDGMWYDIYSVYEDHFVFHNWDRKVFYGCKYKKEEDSISLDGERYLLHQELLTDSELASLNEMRANYEFIKEKLDSYEKKELDKEKDAVFTDEAYSQYLETEEFKDLMMNKDNYSVDELKEKAEVAFAKCVRKNGTFSVNKPVGKLLKHSIFSTKENVEEKKPYGSLFD